MKCRVLITGAAGFIGSALCERIASEGYEVLGIDNLNNYYDVRLKYGRLERMGFEGIGEADNKRSQSLRYSNLSFVRSDITDKVEMEEIFKSFSPEIVINLAAQAGVRYSIENPYTYISNNVDGFLVMLECSRHYPVKKFIYASSSSVYGSESETPFREDSYIDNPQSLYAATKISNEMMARAYRNLYGLPVIGLRFFTVYGPWGRPDMAPMLFADAIIKGKPLQIYNYGDMKRDFTYIDDIIEGVAQVVSADKKNMDRTDDILNIGLGSPVSLMDFVAILEREFGCEAKKEFMPMQKGDVPVTYADTGRLQKLYGYLPSTSLEKGIKQFAKWYLSADNPLK